MFGIPWTQIGVGAGLLLTIGVLWWRMDHWHDEYRVAQANLQTCENATAELEAAGERMAQSIQKQEERIADLARANEDRAEAVSEANRRLAEAERTRDETIREIRILEPREGEDLCKQGMELLRRSD